jgi:hypothetical protein
MMKGKEVSCTVLGGSSILTIFAVLCLIVFALLSLSTAKADSRLMEKSIEAVSSYYKADLQAEEILAQIRSGEIPKSVRKEGNVYFFECSVDENQQLQVEVKVHEGNYKIMRWQKVYVGNWTADNSVDVWDGM